jgi:quinol-cytochrome oxidoreductase complex cytochrome b subunit
MRMDVQEKGSSFWFLLGFPGGRLRTKLSGAWRIQNAALLARRRPIAIRGFVLFISTNTCLVLTGARTPASKNSKSFIIFSMDTLWILTYFVRYCLVDGVPVASSSSTNWT